MTTEAKPKTGFFSTIGKSLFEDAPEPEHLQPVQPTRPLVSKPVVFNHVPVVAPQEKIDPAILTKLEGLLSQNAPEAYKVFVEKYELLADVIPDEAVRFQAALKTSKINAANLVESFDVLIAALGKASNDFDKSYEAQQIVANQIAKDIEKKTQELQDLTAKHEALTQESTGVRNKFCTARDFLVGRITEQKQNAASYVKTG